jgi:hypothetical protein
MDMKNLEKKMARTHLVFKRQANVLNKGRQLASFAKTLSPDALALLLLNFLASLAPVLTKAKLAQRLRESCNNDEMWTDHIEPIVSDLYEDLPQRNLKLSDLLEDVRELGQ